MFRIRDKTGLYWCGFDIGVSDDKSKALHFKTYDEAETEKSLIESGNNFPLCKWQIARVYHASQKNID